MLHDTFAWLPERRYHRPADDCRWSKVALEPQLAGPVASAGWVDKEPGKRQSGAAIPAPSLQSQSEASPEQSISRIPSPPLAKSIQSLNQVTRLVSCCRQGTIAAPLGLHRALRARGWLTWVWGWAVPSGAIIRARQCFTQQWLFSRTAMEVLHQTSGEPRASTP